MFIKTCPHCGGTACLTTYYNNKAQAYFVFVKCDICGAQGKLYSCEENPVMTNWENTACTDAENAWNMRTPAPPDRGN